MEIRDVARPEDWDVPECNRLLVFAGSFDPLAAHHVNIIRHVLLVTRDLYFRAEGISAEVVIWPVGAYSTKQQVASGENRKAMLAAGLDDLDVVLVTRDLDLSEGYTPTAQMEELLSPYGEVLHVIGADNVPNIRSWEEGERLWKQSKFVILSRPGYWLVEQPSFIFNVPVTYDGQSSAVRSRIAAGEPWRDLVPPPVASIIESDGLYGYRPQPRR